jgi:hypothetical protein
LLKHPQPQDHLLHLKPQLSQKHQQSENPQHL